MRKHHELRAWQSSMELVEQVYAITANFPQQERFGLTNQLRRAAVSVPSNIAEGAARGSDADFLRFLYFSRGSLSEIETQLLIAKNLNFINDIQDIKNLIEQSFTQLGGLIKHLKNKKMAYVKEEYAPYNEAISHLTDNPLNLTEDDFKQIVENAPLFAIDLVVVNNQNQILVGERLNAPAKGSWFVPGGRVYKNESLEDAFKRISKSELGLEIERHHTPQGGIKAWLLGLYDHFYDDSFFSSDISTHYINATHVVKLANEQLNLPQDQHSHYQWIAMDSLNVNNDVHQYSKIFLPELKRWMETHD